MNKKNITINTDFFDEGSEAKLIERTDSIPDGIEGKQVSSRLDQFQNFIVQTGHSDYQHQNQTKDSQYHEQDHSNSNMEVLTMKLNAANEMQNILSRTQTRLFIMWWDELISKLHQMYYSSPEYNKIQQTQKQQIIQDYNNVFFNQNQQKNREGNQEEAKQNVFSIRQNRKQQLIERQRMGITLDSLQKLKSQRSKSGTRIYRQKKSSKKNQESKETFTNQQVENSSVSGISRKSYRDKFMEYKHKSKSKQPSIPKSQTYTKFISQYPQVASADQTYSLNRTYTSNKIRNVQSASDIQKSKNDILRNINHLLMDREDIYQGQDYRYYINHRDNSKNIYTFDNHSYQNYPGSSYSRPLKIGYNQQMTEMQSTQAQDDEMIRARLIDQIVQKLKYSKIRLQEVHKKQQKNDESEVLNKLNRLEKIIMEIKTEGESKPQIREPEVRQYQRSLDEQLYRKFVQEIANIKAQINLIKTLRQSSSVPVQVIQPQPQSIILDNSSSHIIAQQQKMLSNYQRQYERLLQERSKVVVVEKSVQPLPVPVVKQNNINNGQQSLIGQMILRGKGSSKKVGWEDGWQLKEQKKERVTVVNNTQNRQRLSQSIYRKAQDEIKESYSPYRYTRRQILQSIGLRDRWRQQQRLWGQRQRRQEVKRQFHNTRTSLTKQVKKSRVIRGEQQSRGLKDGRSIRQRQQQIWNRKRVDVDEDVDSNLFCQLFPCK